MRYEHVGRPHVVVDHPLAVHIRERRGHIGGHVQRRGGVPRQGGHVQGYRPVEDRADWAAYEATAAEGVRDDLASVATGGDRYTDRLAFLGRAEVGEWEAELRRKGGGAGGAGAGRSGRR